MPLYEYVCRACGKPFEAYVRAWNEAAACPACAATDVEKQVSRFAFSAAGGSPAVPSGGGCGCGRGGCGCHR